MSIINKLINKIGRASILLVIMLVLLQAFVFSCRSSSIIGETNTIILNFDRLFPQTPFGYVLESCMQLYEDMNNIQNIQSFQSICETKSGKQELGFFSDALVGKLFHIKTSIEGMRCQHPPVHQEDIAYLISLFDKILNCYKQECSFCKNMPQADYLSQLIRDIKRKLRTFF